MEMVNVLKGQLQQTVQTHVCAALCSLLKVLHLYAPQIPLQTPECWVAALCYYQQLCLLLSTWVAFRALWGQRRYVLQRCRSCQGLWRVSVLCCGVWLQKVWPGCFRLSETLASLSQSLCSASTGTIMVACYCYFYYHYYKTYYYYEYCY